MTAGTEKMRADVFVRYPAASARDLRRARLRTRGRCGGFLDHVFLQQSKRPYACGNSDTQKYDPSEAKTGFKGFITSDWGGNHASDFIKRLARPGDARDFLDDAEASLMPSYFRPDPPPHSKPWAADVSPDVFIGGSRKSPAKDSLFLVPTAR